MVKVQLSTFEALIGFINQFMNQAASLLETGRFSNELYKMKGFYCQEEGGRLREELLINRVGLQS